MARVRILIRNKKGVFDPEGKVVHGALGRLGFGDVDDVAVGKVVELDVAATGEEAIREEVDRMCRAFLVNPVIEDYEVELLEPGS